MEIVEIYTKLLAEYGPQGWWPLLSHDGTNPTKTGSVTGYHVGDYSFPRTLQQRFEICVGAILTQNTAWTNVEKALINLQKLGALDAEGLHACSDQELQEAIRPSGYYNAKTRKLREFVRFFNQLKGAVPSRERLLSVWGVGPETADSILLYAYGQMEMVVDAYTRRVLAHWQLVREDDTYDQVKLTIENSLPRELAVYQEFHALMVEHAKRHKSRDPGKMG